MTPTDLAAAASVSVPTVHRALTDLRQEGWLEGRESGGAAGVARLSRKATLVVGVDIGRAHRRAGCAGPHGAIIGKPAQKDFSGTPDDFGSGLLTEIVDLILDAIDEANKTGLEAGQEPYRLDEVQAIGVGIPFPVSSEGVTVGMFAPQLSGLELGKTVQGLLRKKAAELGVSIHPKLKVRFAKDGDLGAMAAWRDHVEACRDGTRELSDPHDHSLVFAKASFGLDAGIICHGQLVAGVRGLAGQIGHMWVPRLEEPLRDRIYGAYRRTGFVWPTEPCERCGRTYCLENVASGRAILEQVAYGREAKDRPATVEQLIRFLNKEQNEHQATRNAVIGAAGIIGVVLADAVRLADPAEIIVGGLLAEAGETFMTPLRIAFAEAGLPGLEPKVTAVQKDRVKRIELEGAIALALKQVEFQWR